MFFGSRKYQKTRKIISMFSGKTQIISIISLHKFQKQKKYNERNRFTTELSPQDTKTALSLLSPKTKGAGGRRTFFSASLTVEAAVVLPVFLICMLTMLQLLNVYGSAVRLQSAMTQTGEEMAIGAYASRYDGGDESLMKTALTIGYASVRTRSKAGSLTALKNVNFLLSNMPDADGMVDLVCTYRMNTLFGMVKLPGTYFVQRAAVRAWTGRSGSGGASRDSSDGTENDIVYVAENGVVYHKDLNCTHIRLSIQSVTKAQAEAKRNRYGERYHSCEKCGRSAGESVYITTDGNRYHSSLACSGLKRTISEMHQEDIGGLRPCSKCG